MPESHLRLHECPPLVTSAETSKSEGLGNWERDQMTGRQSSSGGRKTRRRGNLEEPGTGRGPGGADSALGGLLGADPSRVVNVDVGNGTQSRGERSGELATRPAPMPPAPVHARHIFRSSVAKLERGRSSP